MKQRTTSVATITIVALLMLVVSGCTEIVNPFAPLNGESSVTIETVQDGAVLTPDSAVEVLIEVGETVTELERPTSATITLSDLDGNIVDELTFGMLSTSSRERSFLTVTDATPPIVNLEVIVTGVTEELARVQRQLFVIPPPPIVSNLALYPPIAETDSQSLATIDVIADETLRPYVRWYFDDILRAEGYWESGFRVAFNTPRREGVYGVRADLYPFGPDEGVVLRSDNAPVQYESELYVVYIRDPAPGELTPTDSTVALYHLSGNLRNSVAQSYRDSDSTGEAAVTLPLIADGTPMLMIQDDVFGYFLGISSTGERSALTMSDTIIPGVDETTRFDLQFLPFSTEGRAQVLRTISEDGTQLTVYWEDGLTLGVSVDSGSFEQVGQIPLLWSEGKIDMTVITTYTAGQLTMGWFQQDLPIGILSFPMLDDADVSSSDQATGLTVDSTVDPSTTLSGEDGIVGIFDEMALSLGDSEEFIAYQRERTMRYLRSLHGDAMLSADIFQEATVLEPWLSSETSVPYGGIELEIVGEQSIEASPYTVEIERSEKTIHILRYHDRIEVESESGSLSIPIQDATRQYYGTLQFFDLEAGAAVQMDDRSYAFVPTEGEPVEMTEKTFETLVREAPRAAETGVTRFALYPIENSTLRLSRVVVLQR